MALSKFNKSLSQPVDSKKQNDEIMKAMLVQQAQNASIIKDKVSHLELRQDMDFKTDLQGALGEADGKRAKITKDEVESKKVKEVIGLFQDNPELQAMIKLAFKVDNHIWNPQGEEGFEIVEGPELFTQCMLELYQCYEVFNRTRSYSKAKRDEEAKSALESQYKLFSRITSKTSTRRTRPGFGWASGSRRFARNKRQTSGSKQSPKSSSKRARRRLAWSSDILRA